MGAEGGGIWLLTRSRSWLAEVNEKLPITGKTSSSGSTICALLVTRLVPPCFLWSPEFKNFTSPAHTPTGNDAKRPVHFYSDTFVELFE